MAGRRKLCFAKPRSGKLSSAIRHVAPTEDAKLEHFRRRQLRLEPFVEIFSERLGAFVDVALLHEIIDNRALRPHSNAITFPVNRQAS